MTTLSPLLLPPRLVVRAMDDLHTLAQAARWATEVGEELDVRGAVRDMRSLAEAARRLPDIERTLVGTEKELAKRADRLDARLREALKLVRSMEGDLPAVAGVLETADSINSQLTTVTRLADRVDDGLPSFERVLDSVDALREATAILAAAVEPLQGISERLGRVADRLPGGVRARG